MTAEAPGCPSPTVAQPQRPPSQTAPPGALQGQKGAAHPGEDKASRGCLWTWFPHKQPTFLGAGFTVAPVPGKLFQPRPHLPGTPPPEGGNEVEGWTETTPNTVWGAGEGV